MDCGQKKMNSLGNIQASLAAAVQAIAKAISAICDIQRGYWELLYIKQLRQKQNAIKWQRWGAEHVQAQQKQWQYK